MRMLCDGVADSYIRNPFIRTVCTLRIMYKVSCIITRDDASGRKYGGRLFLKGQSQSFMTIASYRCEHIMRI